MIATYLMYDTIHYIVLFVKRLREIFFIFYRTVRKREKKRVPSGGGACGVAGLRLAREVGATGKARRARCTDLRGVRAAA